MNEEQFEKIYERASKLFRKHQGRIKGQQITAADSFDYWIAMVAYQTGCNEGYNEGYNDCVSENAYKEFEDN